MPSSISSSRKPKARDIALLLLVCVLFCALLELGARLHFSRISQMEHRRQVEYQNALTMRSLKDRQAASILIVGNSLLLEGVNFPQLQKDFDPRFELQRTVIENTFYLDWYYALRRMFRLGARPDIVVVMLNPIQLTSPAFDGDYSAHLLVDRRDLLSFARDVEADRNATSSLLLANLSSFYGTRTEIRSWILGHILPGLPQLFHSGAAPRPTVLPELASQRIAQLREVCEQHGTQLVLVLPPARLSSGVDVVTQAATANRVNLLLPIAPGVLPSSDYSDNFHLNSSGAGKFTPALAAGLRQVLSQANVTVRSGDLPVEISAELKTTTVGARPLAAAVVTSQQHQSKTKRR